MLTIWNESYYSYTFKSFTFIAIVKKNDSGDVTKMKWNVKKLDKHFPKSASVFMNSVNLPDNFEKLFSLVLFMIVCTKLKIAYFV